MRVRIGVMVLALVVLGAAYFQDNPPTKVRGQLPTYYKKLGLRDDQVQAIYKLRANYKTKIDDLKMKIEKLRADEKGALEKVLTADQLKRLRELRTGEKSPTKDKTTEKDKAKEKTADKDKAKEKDK